MTIAIVPARGGSKRIPRKNIKPFRGKPMIQWSIEAALASGCFEQVIVSTDDDEIAEVARMSGAVVPFRRPEELADDHTTARAVVEHAISWCRAAGRALDHACCLYPTAPFVTPDDLRQGRDALTAGDLAFVFSATTYAFPIQRALGLDDAGRLRMLQPEHMNTRSQDLPTVFHDAGQFYWGRADAWLDGTPIFGPRAGIVMIERHRVQDIDTPEDWRRAELMHQLL